MKVPAPPPPVAVAEPTRAPSPHLAQRGRPREADDAYDALARRALVSRETPRVQAKATVDPGYGDLIAAARTPAPAPIQRAPAGGTILERAAQSAQARMATDFGYGDLIDATRTEGRPQSSAAGASRTRAPVVQRYAEVTLDHAQWRLSNANKILTPAAATHDLYAEPATIQAGEEALAAAGSFIRLAGRDQVPEGEAGAAVGRHRLQKVVPSYRRRGATARETPGAHKNKGKEPGLATLNENDRPLVTPSQCIDAARMVMGVTAGGGERDWEMPVADLGGGSRVYERQPNPDFRDRDISNPMSKPEPSPTERGAVTVLNRQLLDFAASPELGRVTAAEQVARFREEAKRLNLNDPHGAWVVLHAMKRNTPEVYTAFTRYAGIDAAAAPEVGDALVTYIAETNAGRAFRTSRRLYDALVARLGQEAVTRMGITADTPVHVVQRIVVAAAKATDPNNQHYAALSEVSEANTLWNMHWAGIVLKDGTDYASLENDASTQGPSVEGGADTAATQTRGAINASWRFQLYGTGLGQSFHEQMMASGDFGEFASTTRFRRPRPGEAALGKNDARPVNPLALMALVMTTLAQLDYSPVATLDPGGEVNVTVTNELRAAYLRDLVQTNAYLSESEGNVLARTWGVHADVFIQQTPSRNRVYRDARTGRRFRLSGLQTAADGNCLIHGLKLILAGAIASPEEIQRARMVIALQFIARYQEELRVTLEQAVADFIKQDEQPGMGPNLRQFLQRNVSVMSAKVGHAQVRAARASQMPIEERSPPDQSPKKSTGSSGSSPSAPDSGETGELVLTATYGEGQAHRGALLQSGGHYMRLNEIDAGVGVGAETPSHGIDEEFWGGVQRNLRAAGSDPQRISGILAGLSKQRRNELRELLARGYADLSAPAIRLIQAMLNNVAEYDSPPSHEDRSSDDRGPDGGTGASGPGARGRLIAV
jgi:hypothetical protein